MSIDQNIYTSEIEALVPIVAKLSNVRKIVWNWANKLSSDQGKIILTGHNLREIDSTQYKVIHLVVDDDIAGERILDRSNYPDIKTAIESVKRRNEID